MFEEYGHAQTMVTGASKRHIFSKKLIAKVRHNYSKYSLCVWPLDLIIETNFLSFFRPFDAYTNLFAPTGSSAKRVTNNVIFFYQFTSSKYCILIFCEPYSIILFCVVNQP